jgi:hypothetical protein
MFAAKGDTDRPGRIRNLQTRDKKRLRQTDPEETREVSTPGNAAVGRYGLSCSADVRGAQTS